MCEELTRQLEKEHEDGKQVLGQAAAWTRKFIELNVEATRRGMATGPVTKLDEELNVEATRRGMVMAAEMKRFPLHDWRPG